MGSTTARQLGPHSRPNPPNSAQRGKIPGKVRPMPPKFGRTSGHMLGPTRARCGPSSAKLGHMWLGHGQSEPCGSVSANLGHISPGIGEMLLDLTECGPTAGHAAVNFVPDSALLGRISQDSDTHVPSRFRPRLCTQTIWWNKAELRAS